MAGDSLLVVTEIRQALAEAKDLSDVLLIRDKAEMMRRLLKTQGESLAAQNEMAELTARAEVLIGKSLAKMDKHSGRPNKRLQTATVSLADLGIEKTAAHRWQTMAHAEKRITRLVQQATAEGKDFTRAMVYREGKRIKDGDKPPKPPKNVGDWITSLRTKVQNVYDEAPPEFREIMANVLRDLASDVDSWEAADGASRRAGVAAAG